MSFFGVSYLQMCEYMLALSRGRTHRRDSFSDFVEQDLKYMGKLLYSQNYTRLSQLYNQTLSMKTLSRIDSSKYTFLQVREGRGTSSNSINFSAN